MSPRAALASLFDNAAFGIAVLAPNGDVIDSNEVFRSFFGTSSKELLREHKDAFQALTAGESDIFEFEQQLSNAAADGAWVACTLSRAQNQDADASAICLVRDITHVKENERRMLHDMTHDPLTGMPNRLFFESRLRERLAAYRSRQPASLAVMTLDIDHFREINEGFGHESGDFVVSEVGKRLGATIGGDDLVARVGTDQFAILAKSDDNPRHAEFVGRRIFGALAKPLELRGRTIYVSASVGIAAVSLRYTRADEVMRDAHIATRYAKSSGGSRTAVFDEQMALRAHKRLELSNDMRAGLQRGEFYLVFQPIVRLDDGGFAGCEALLRWNHPTYGLLPPSEFVPLAEQTGLATQVGRLVTRLACEQLAAWRDKQNLRVRMNVNVAWPDLLEAEFEQSLISTTKQFAVDPAQLTLEITENIVLNPGGSATAVVERLRRHGFGICIDDFGTGYSSLHYLQRFKIDAMKIDRSFVCGSDGAIASEPIVRALLTLAEGFGVRVVAEGIETQSQAQALEKAGCIYGQGFFFSKPLAAVQLVAKYPADFGGKSSCQSG